MPKYQIILESDEILTDQEIQDLFNTIIDNKWNSLRLNELEKFKLIYAQNLEGIKKELWEKKEIIKQDLCSYGDDRDQKGLNDKLIEESFDEIKNLFKLD